MVIINLQTTKHHGILVCWAKAYPPDKFIQFGEKLLGTFYGGLFIYVPLQENIQCLDIPTL